MIRLRFVVFTIALASLTTGAWVAHRDQSRNDGFLRESSVPLGSRPAAVRAATKASNEWTAALERAEQQPVEMRRNNAIEALVVEWIARAPFDAWDWILAAPEREAFALPALRALAQHAPVDALSFALNWKSADSIEVFYALQVVIDVPISAGNFRVAADLASLAPEGDLRRQLNSHLAAMWGGDQPLDALQWAATLPEETDRASLADRIFLSWAAHAPAAAAAFVQEMPFGPPRTAATTDVLIAWSHDDFSAAEAWLSQIPLQANLDPAIAVMARNPGLLAAAPARALLWAERISNVRDRADVVSTVLRSAGQRVPAASAPSAAEESAVSSAGTPAAAYEETSP